MDKMVDLLQLAVSIGVGPSSLCDQSQRLKRFDGLTFEQGPLQHLGIKRLARARLLGSAGTMGAIHWFTREDGK